MKFDDTKDSTPNKVFTNDNNVVEFKPKQNGIDKKIDKDILLAVIQSPLFASQPGNIEELTNEMVTAARKFTGSLNGK